jgi:hypothetical protein
MNPPTHKATARQGKPKASPVEKAFLESAGNKFLGETLQPYTPSRVVAAQAMGLKYPNIGKEGVAQLKKTGLYPGELRDVIIVIFLCRLVEKADVLDAQLDPVAAYEAAEKWAGESGVTSMGQNFRDAVLIYEKILNEIDESKTVQKSEVGGQRSAEEDEEDPND